MKTYLLKQINNDKDIVSKTIADSYETACSLFAKRKRIKIDDLLKIYIVQVNI